MKNNFRKTTQDLLPVEHKPTPVGQYDIYPAFPINDGKIGVGFEYLAERIARHECIVIDGYIGVMWEEFRAKLDVALQVLGKKVHWVDIADCVKATDLKLMYLLRLIWVEMTPFLVRGASLSCQSIIL